MPSAHQWESIANSQARAGRQTAQQKRVDGSYMRSIPVLVKVPDPALSEKFNPGRHRFDIRSCDEQQAAGIQQGCTLPQKVTRVFQVLNNLNGRDHLERFAFQEAGEILVQVALKKTRSPAELRAIQINRTDLPKSTVQQSIAPGAGSCAEVKDRAATGREQAAQAGESLIVESWCRTFPEFARMRNVYAVEQSTFFSIG
jgi:hypothetical protein